MMWNPIFKFSIIFLLSANFALASVDIINEYAEQTLPLLNENFNKLNDNDLKHLENRGDPTAADFTQANLTTDNTWRDLDLSGTGPKGAKAVFLFVKLTDDAAGSELSFRKNGNFAAINISTIATQVVNVSVYADLMVFLDTDGKVEYRGSNLAFTAITITVKGWLK